MDQDGRFGRLLPPSSRMFERSDGAREGGRIDVAGVVVRTVGRSGGTIKCGLALLTAASLKRSSAWTKAALLDRRVESTRIMSKALPKLLVCRLRLVGSVEAAGPWGRKGLFLETSEADEGIDSVGRYSRKSVELTPRSGPDASARTAFQGPSNQAEAGPIGSVGAGCCEGAVAEAELVDPGKGSPGRRRRSDTYDGERDARRWTDQLRR